MCLLTGCSRTKAFARGELPVCVCVRVMLAFVYVCMCVRFMLAFVYVCVRVRVMLACVYVQVKLSCVCACAGWVFVCWDCVCIAICIC